jgi:predicted nucleic acid-binding protein
MSIYAYDAYVIDCALSLNCPLITLDQGLIYAATTAGVTLIEVKS